MGWPLLFKLELIAVCGYAHNGAVTHVMNHDAFHSLQHVSLLMFFPLLACCLWQVIAHC